MTLTKKRNFAVAILFFGLIAGISIAGIVTQFRFEPQQAAFWDICTRQSEGSSLSPVPS